MHPHLPLLIKGQDLQEALRHTTHTWRRWGHSWNCQPNDIRFFLQEFIAQHGVLRVLGN
jgi:hypothetical protein